MNRMAVMALLLSGITVAQDDQRQETLDVYKGAQALMAFQWDAIRPCGWVIAYKQGRNMAQQLTANPNPPVNPAKFKTYHASVTINLVKTLNHLIRSRQTFSEACPLEAQEKGWAISGALVLSKTYQVVELLEDALRDQPSTRTLVSVDMAEEWKTSVKTSAPELAKECEGSNRASFGLETPCHTLQKALNRGMTPEELNLTPKRVAKLIKKTK